MQAAGHVKQRIDQNARRNAALRRFLGLIAGVRPQLRKVTLFGSRARGDFRSDSDYDLLLVVSVRSPELEVALYDAVLETLLSTGRLISLKVFSEAEFKRLSAIQTPFMKRIQKEGVDLG